MERHFFRLIIKTNVAYLPLKRHLFYPVFFYNINNVIIFNIFRQVRHNGFRCFNCKTLSKYRNFFYYFDTLIIYGMFYRFGLIDVPDEVLVDRVQGRVMCDKCGASYHLKNNPPAVEGVCDKCGGHLEARSDDRPETVRARLKVYHELTDPVVDFYRGRGVLSEIDGTKSIENATAEILKILEG